MSTLICLATCNGRQWLPAQLESLLQQSDTAWRLLISDDRSTDGTADILGAFCERDSRIEVLPLRRGTAGAVGNFEYLLAAAAERLTAAVDCIALCDQDDIWLRDKLRQQRAVLQSAQGCCSDLVLIDETDTQIAPSLLSQLHAPAETGMAGLLAQNAVVGCSFAFRPAVLELALPFPVGLMNHDWWLALCTLALGDLQCVPRPLVHYRQHAANVVGAYRPARQLFRLPRLLSRQRAVLRGQLHAVEELMARLQARGMPPPEPLPDYLARVGSDRALIRTASLLSGAFAAPHRPLRYLRGCAALRSLR